MPFTVLISHYNSKTFLQDELNIVKKKFESWRGNSTNSDIKIAFFKRLVRGVHQHRLTNDAINTAIEKLDLDKLFLRCHFDNFEELHKYVSDRILSIKGISHLTVYDTALRIGSVLTPQIMPKDYVYLSRGALKGAKNLLAQNGKRLKLDNKIRLCTKVFQQFFSSFESADIEVMLCIYKDFFIFNGLNPKIKTSQDIENAYLIKKQLKNSYKKQLLITK